MQAVAWVYNTPEQEDRQSQCALLKHWHPHRSWGEPQQTKWFANFATFSDQHSWVHGVHVVGNADVHHVSAAWQAHANQEPKGRLLHTASTPLTCVPVAAAMATTIAAPAAMLGSICLLRLVSLVCLQQGPWLALPLLVISTCTGVTCEHTAAHEDSFSVGGIECR